MPRCRALLLACALSSAVLLPHRAHAAREAAAAAYNTDHLAQDLVSQAQKYLGTPYVWGGQGATGFDCSGFVGRLYQQIGYTLPRVSRQQALIGLSVAFDALAPGDLLFFSEHPAEARIAHVAMSLGGTRFIHAALGRGAVSYDHLGERYYAARLVAARRLLSLPPGNYSTALGLAPARLVSTQPSQLGVLAEAYHEGRLPEDHPPRAEVPADMLMEHAGAKLPAQLTVLGNRHNILGGTFDGFEPVSWAPEETGVGVRTGITHAPRNTPGFAVAQANIMVVPWGFWAALRMPVLLPMWGPLPQAGVAYVPWHTARQWGRLLYGATLGSPGAKLFVALDRTAALNIGMGLLMRHYVPSAASSTLDDLLVFPNPLSGTAEFNGQALTLRAVVDDVLAPRTLGAHVHYRPPVGVKGDRLTLSLAWAADVHAPTTGMVTPTATTATSQPKAFGAIHGVELGASLLAWDGATTQLRPYVALASLQTTTRRRPLRVGAAVGTTWALYQGHMGGSEHTLVLRAEGRVSQAGFAPSYFGLGYGAARVAAFGHSDANPQAGGPSKLAVLLNQERGPARLTALGEVQYALARRLQLGVRYEDGGPTGAVPTDVFNPSDRTLSVYAGLHNTPLGFRHMLLHLHALWHAEQVSAPWPGHRASSGHAYTQLTGKVDVAQWLDGVVTVLHPLGAKPAGTRTWVSSISVNVHTSF